MGRPSTPLTRARKERADRLRAFRDGHAALSHACTYCGIVPNYLGRWADRPSVDHSIPTTKGGTDDEANLVYCCHGCNSTKNNKTVAEARLLLRLRRLGWPRFSEAQIDWLRGRGLDLSELDAMKLHYEERADPNA